MVFRCSVDLNGREGKAIGPSMSKSLPERSYSGTCSKSHHAYARLVSVVAVIWEVSLTVLSGYVFPSNFLLVIFAPCFFNSKNVNCNQKHKLFTPSVLSRSCFLALGILWKPAC